MRNLRRLKCNLAAIRACPSALHWLELWATSPHRKSTSKEDLADYSEKELFVAAWRAIPNTAKTRVWRVWAIARTLPTEDRKSFLDKLEAFESPEEFEKSRNVLTMAMSREEGSLSKSWFADAVDDLFAEWGVSRINALADSYDPADVYDRVVVLMDKVRKEYRRRQQ